MNIGRIRLQTKRVTEVNYCLVEFSSGREEVPQIVMSEIIVRSYFQCLLKALYSLVNPSLLGQNIAQIVIARCRRSQLAGERPINHRCAERQDRDTGETVSHPALPAKRNSFN